MALVHITLPQTQDLVILKLFITLQN